MALLTRRRDLDAWAQALGAKTDDEALARLKRLSARVDVVLGELTEISSVMTDAPGDAGTEFRSAYFKATAGSNQLADVVTAFQRHERG